MWKKITILLVLLPALSLTGLFATSSFAAPPPADLLNSQIMLPNVHAYSDTLSMIMLEYGLYQVDLIKIVKQFSIQALISILGIKSAQWQQDGEDSILKADWCGQKIEIVLSQSPVNPNRCHLKKLSGFGPQFKGENGLILFYYLALSRYIEKNIPEMMVAQKYCQIIEIASQEMVVALGEYFQRNGNARLPQPDDLKGVDLPEGVTLSISQDADSNAIRLILADELGRCNKGTRFVISVPENPGDGWQ